MNCNVLFEVRDTENWMSGFKGFVAVEKKYGALNSLLFESDNLYNVYSLLFDVVFKITDPEEIILPSTIFLLNSELNFVESIVGFAGSSVTMYASKREGPVDCLIQLSILSGFVNVNVVVIESNE